MPTKNCIYCGKEIVVKPARMERTKFCSRACLGASKVGQPFAEATQFKKGNLPPNYREGNYTSKGYDYLRMPTHPRANVNGYVLKHILAWEAANSRQVPEGYVIHHINGIRSDNRPENLLAMPKRNHSPALNIKQIQSRLRQVEAELRRLKAQLRMPI